MDNQGEPRRPWRLRPVAEGMRVTRLEIFFDLVFVYALSNVARSTFRDLSTDGLLRGLLVLVLLWWCWISYVWVGNSVRATEGAMPVVLFIIIIALGELIISVGTGTNPLDWPITWTVLGAAILAIIVTAALWWAYFDIIALAAQLALHHTHAAARVTLARHAYIYLHLPMLVGLLTLAIGAEGLLAQVSDRGIPSREPLHPPDAYLLFGGVVLFLLGHLGFQLRSLGTLTWLRAGAIVLLAALAPVAALARALVALGILAAVLLALGIAELVLLADSRRVLREAVLQEHLAHEARETEWRRRHR